MEWIFEDGNVQWRIFILIWLVLFYLVALVKLGNSMNLPDKWDVVLRIFAFPLWVLVLSWEKLQTWTWGKFQIWRFKREFGFWPGSDVGAQQATQRFVDVELKFRAAVFYECCSEEQAFLAEGHKFCGSAKEVSERLVDIRRRLGYTKARFWRAHSMARRAYYQVKESYRLYLS